MKYFLTVAATKSGRFFVVDTAGCQPTNTTVWEQKKTRSSAEGKLPGEVITVLFTCGGSTASWATPPDLDWACEKERALWADKWIPGKSWGEYIREVAASDSKAGKRLPVDANA